MEKRRKKVASETESTGSPFIFIFFLLHRFNLRKFQDEESRTQVSLRRWRNREKERRRRAEAAEILNERLGFYRQQEYSLRPLNELIIFLRVHINCLPC